MATFKFDIRDIFTQPTVKVSSNLLPHTFRGDRRMAQVISSKMSQIIDHLGELSAVAQKLTKPVTSAQKLRLSENQTVYVMADINDCDGDAVVGLLKVGTKNLYLFDHLGETRKVDRAPCILDFYIHESRQRTGLGKKLFDLMLAEESWTPVQCSVDRPSEKLLQFLKKYYGLENIIPQTNKFVLYHGFFDENEDTTSKQVIKKMEASHNKIQTLHKTKAPKTHASKTASDISLTPSQLAEQATLNGLQDVDDEYFKKNIFARSNLNKRSGLNDIYEHKGHPSSMAQADASTAQRQQQLQAAQQSNASHLTQNHFPTTQSQHPTMQQPAPAEYAAQRQQLQQQQQQQQQPTQSSATMPFKNQSYKETRYPQPHKQQQNYLAQQQQYMQPPPPSHAPNSAAPREPELCTTCPNCQTTIYLVRSNETSEMPAPVQGTNPTATNTTANQVDTTNANTITTN